MTIDKANERVLRIAMLIATEQRINWQTLPPLVMGGPCQKGFLDLATKILGDLDEEAFSNIGSGNNSYSGKDLKPCPFCGPGQSIVSRYQDEYGLWSVGCGCCGSHSGKRPNRDPDGAAKVTTLWNTRLG